MSNALICVISVVLILIVVFYFIVISCAAGSAIGTTKVLEQCKCANCQDKGCENCPLCPKKAKEPYVGGYMSLAALNPEAYALPVYPMMFGEQGPPAAIEPSNVTNKYLTLDHHEDMLLRELKAPENINYIHGFIGSKYNNDKLIYEGVV